MTKTFLALILFITRPVRLIDASDIREYDYKQEEYESDDLKMPITEMRNFTEISLMESDLKEIVSFSTEEDIDKEKQVNHSEDAVPLLNPTE